MVGAMNKKNPVGRPKLPEGDGKTEQIIFRVTKDDRKLYEHAAAEAKLELSEWMRMRLLRKPMQQTLRMESENVLIQIQAPDGVDDSLREFLRRYVVEVI